MDKKKCSTRPIVEDFRVVVRGRMLEVDEFDPEGAMAVGFGRTVVCMALMDKDKTVAYGRQSTKYFKFQASFKLQKK